MPDTVAGRPGLTPQKQSALTWIDSNLARLSADHLTIWNFHEPAWREYRSARWYVERLRAAGFEVEAGSGAMPTAFRAVFTLPRRIWDGINEHLDPTMAAVATVLIALTVLLLLLDIAVRRRKETQ